MRVAYLCTEFPPRIYGGLGVYVDCISREMVALEQDVSVFVPGDTDLASHERLEVWKSSEKYRFP